SSLRLSLHSDLVLLAQVVGGLFAELAGADFSAAFFDPRRTQDPILRFIEDHNHAPNPIVWTDPVVSSCASEPNDSSHPCEKDQPGETPRCISYCRKRSVSFSFRLI